MTSLHLQRIVDVKTQRRRQKAEHSGATKIVIKSLAPHKNIPPRVAVNTNNRNSVRAISVHSMYSTDRGIHRVEHSKIRN